MSSEERAETDLGKKLFIISPIGDLDSETRDASDKVKRHIIDPPATEKGYQTLRPDSISMPGRIDRQIVDHLKDDDLVVADLTDQNPNVFYELAIRHAVRKPVILIGKAGQNIPFDVSAQRVIFYDLADPDSVAESREELKRQISAIESDQFIVDSPIREHESIQLADQRAPTSDEIKEILFILRNQSDQISRIFSQIKVLDDFRAYAADTDSRMRTYYDETERTIRELENVLVKRIDRSIQARGGATGNILISTDVAPSPSRRIILGETIELYFGRVTWSGGQVDLYLSKDGYASLTIPGDIRFGPTFSVADVTSSSLSEIFGDALHYSVGQNWIKGTIPRALEAPSGRYYIKAFCGSTATVAVTDNYIALHRPMAQSTQ